MFFQKTSEKRYYIVCLKVLAVLKEHNDTYHNGEIHGKIGQYIFLKNLKSKLKKKKFYRLFLLKKGNGSNCKS